MALSKLKVGDMVKVMSGNSMKSKGKEGKILKIDRKKNKVYVKGVNMIKKHTKPSAANQAGGIVEIEGPIHISNVMLMHNGQPTRVGVKVVKDEKTGEVKKYRYAKKTGEVIE